MTFLGVHPEKNRQKSRKIEKKLSIFSIYL